MKIIIALQENAGEKIGRHSRAGLLCGHIFFKNGLGIMLADFNKPQSLPKDAVNPKWRENQKNRCTMDEITLPNLKRSGFVFISIEFKI